MNADVRKLLVFDWFPHRAHAFLDILLYIFNGSLSGVMQYVSNAEYSVTAVNYSEYKMLTISAQLEEIRRRSDSRVNLNLKREIGPVFALASTHTFPSPVTSH